MTTPDSRQWGVGDRVLFAATDAFVDTGHVGTVVAVDLTRPRQIQVMWDGSEPPFDLMNCHRDELAPADAVPVCSKCGEARREMPPGYVCRDGGKTVYVDA